MSVPKEPRQLMINLMYLVLTAMLALNVSSEILHAFKIINQSITQSNTSINSKNNELHLAFDANEARPEAHDRVKEFNDKAKQISKEADVLYNYLENWKERVIEESGGYKIDNGEKEIKAENAALKKASSQYRSDIFPLRLFWNNKLQRAISAPLNAQAPNKHLASRATRLRR